jgi:HEPN domain-containing protein
LSLNHKQANEFAQNNQSAMLFIRQATEDYISSRCLILNGFLTGLTLAAQSVEKYLKGFLLLKDNTVSPHRLRHNFVDLFGKLKTISNYQWDPYDNLISRLKGHYQSRYPDNPDKSMRMSGSELVEIDLLILDLNEQMPLPDEVKYRSGLYVVIAESLFPYAQWAIEQNQAINLSKIVQRSTEVKKHLGIQS